MMGFATRVGEHSRNFRCQFALNSDPHFASNSNPLMIDRRVRPEAMRVSPWLKRSAAPEGAYWNGDQLRFLKRQLVLPVSMMSQ